MTKDSDTVGCSFLWGGQGWNAQIGCWLSGGILPCDSSSIEICNHVRAHGELGPHCRCRQSAVCDAASAPQTRDNNTQLAAPGPACLRSPREETGSQAVLTRSSPAGRRQSGLSLKTQHLIQLWWAQRGPESHVQEEKGTTEDELVGGHR